MNEAKFRRIIKKYHVPIHIGRHMQKVAAVGLFIGQKFNENGYKLDPSLLKYGALLHDLVKIVDFQKLDLNNFTKPYTAADVKCWRQLIAKFPSVGHELAACKILTGLKEPQLAAIAKTHRYSSLVAKNKNDRPQTWEEKIIYYSDKRVKHNQIVGLKERILDGQKRYFPDGNVPAHDVHVQKALYKMERELCKKAGIRPEDINAESTITFLPRVSCWR